MITKLIVSNFKKFKKIEFDLNSTVVLIGPNNSGKTSILQALTLWEVGQKKIKEQARLKKSRSKRIGVSINRQDLIALPVSSSKYIWHHQFVREIDRTESAQTTSNIRIDIIVEGISKNKKWISALEFDYANPESIYCRPLRIDPTGNKRYEIDDEAYTENIAYLQPMSGLATKEDKLMPGSIDVRIGEGKTADILRNICYQLLYPDIKSETNELQAENYWQELTQIILQKFGVKLNKPIFIPETGIIEMTYTENDHTYDLSSGGRGFQQTLLLLGYLFSYPGKIVLLDEPDAHLEVIRQREIYNLINNIANKLNSQLIIASHSEVVLNQAADKDTIIALYDDNCFSLNSNQDISQFRKLLTEIGWDKYFLAKTKKHIVYLEGSTDLDILQAFAKKTNHPVLNHLEKANVQYTALNKPGNARNNFYGLKNLIEGLKGFALFDRLETEIEPDPNINIIQWSKREIENFFTFPEVLIRWAESQGDTNLFQNPHEVMEKSIEDNTTPANLKNRNSNWWNDCKMSDDYLPQIFDQFYKELGLPVLFRKGQYYQLVDFLELHEIDKEVIEKLDKLLEILK
ncbi:MAG: AAA family ATPase [Bacteroidales bacterium]|nr:AAA family ATPase [Bacteroidales bacterium]